MEHNHDGSKSKSVCEKIISILCPTSQPNHHPHPKQDPIPASAAPNTSPPTHDHTGNSDYMQIILANGSGAEAAPTGMALMPKAEVSMERQIKSDAKASGLDNNAAFSDYIKRTKIKITAMPSSVGIEKVASRTDVYETRKEDNSKDMFSDFVNRTKIKIRQTSSIGSRKNISFKK